jgi:hypothetical protein
MTNIAFLALTLTLAAEPVTADTADSANKPAATEPAADTTKAAAPETDPTVAAPGAATPAPAAPEAAPPAASAPVVKPSEDDVEVLSEVVDLQETEDPAAAWYGKGFPERIRLLALPTARAVRKGGFEFIIDHRAATPIYNKAGGQPWSDMGNNLLGFDGSIQVGLGLRYGIIERLDAGIYRAGGSLVDTYELDVRYQALRQEEMGVDLAARVGATWFAQRKAEDSSGFFGQLLATRLIANRLLVSAAALYHSNSTNATKYNQDQKYSFGAGGGVELRLAAPVSVDAEVVACVAGYCSKHPAFSGGIKYFTSRHTFALVCGNTQYITADGYLTNTDTPWKNLVIGFNITREY